MTRVLLVIVTFAGSIGVAHAYRLTGSAVTTRMSPVAFKPSAPPFPKVGPKPLAERLAELPPADRLAAIQQGMAQADEKLRKGLADLTKGPDRQKQYEALSAEHTAARSEAAEAAVGLAEDRPRTGAAFDALAWVISLRGGVVYSRAGHRTLELLANDHLGDPRLGGVVTSLYSDLRLHGSILAHRDGDEKSLPPYPAGFLRFVRRVEADSPDPATRGKAALALALISKWRYDAAEVKGRGDLDALAAEAERRLETVAKDYGTHRISDAVKTARTLADLASGPLAELRTLRVGRKAPDIVGADLEGNALKLSDYRGKVVLLVFWAGWCGPCMADVPHELDLADTFDGRPFALVGVNSDGTVEAARKAAGRSGMSWRSFWDGKAEPLGPISTAWNVDRLPTAYVIDHKGVIRYKQLRGEQLDAPLGTLVEAAEAASK